jgi:anti-sigma B factor antagonist
VRVSRASETTGPIGVVIDVDRSRLSERTVTVALSGEIDMFAIPRLRAVLADHVGHVDVVLDLSGIDFCDSSALRILVDAQRSSAAGGHQLVVHDPSPAVSELFEVSGLRGVLRVT